MIQLSVLPESTVRPAPREPLPSDASRLDKAWHALHEVLDPEVPALSVMDLGIVRAVRESDDEVGTLEVDLTPTYSGCPATEVIEASVVDALVTAGLGPVRARTVLSPAWTSDWISDEGLRKLREYGIAPPGRCGASASSGESVIHFVPGPSTGSGRTGMGGSVQTQMGGTTRPGHAFTCPRCGSADTERLSAFGATACKSLHRCLACREPFEAFKSI